MMDRERMELFAVLAGLLEKVTPSQLMDAEATWARDALQGFDEYLSARGLLSEHDRRIIHRLVDELLRACGGDPVEAMRALGGDPVARRFLRREAEPEASTRSAAVAGGDAGQDESNYHHRRGAGAVHAHP